MKLKLFVNLNVDQDFSKHVTSNAKNVVPNTDQKWSTSEINVLYGNKAPTLTNLV